MPAYKGTKELPKPSNKPSRLLFNAMQRERDAIREGRSATDNIQRAERDDAKVMKKGGKVMKKSDKAGRALVKKSADTMGRAMKMNKGGKCYAKGGSVSARADGCATKGKTKGKMV